MSDRSRYSLVDRILWICVAVVMVAGVMPVAMPSIVTVLVVTTVCAIAIRLAFWWTSDRW